MKPILFYYLALYMLVIILKILKELKNTIYPHKFDLSRALSVSMDIVYASAGYVILLLESVREWIAPIVVVYVILVVVSASLDSMEDKFTNKQRYLLNGIIVSIIVLGTFYTFASIINRPITASAKLYVENDYKVIIPYTDKTLVLNIGYGIMAEKKLYYQTTVKANDTQSAITKAIEKFWSDQKSDPLLWNIRQKDKKKYIYFDENGITVINLSTEHT